MQTSLEPGTRPNKNLSAVHPFGACPKYLSPAIHALKVIDSSFAESSFWHYPPLSKTRTPKGSFDAIAKRERNRLTRCFVKRACRHPRHRQTRTQAPPPIRINTETPGGIVHRIANKDLASDSSDRPLKMTTPSEANIFVNSLFTQEPDKARFIPHRYSHCPRFRTTVKSECCLDSSCFFTASPRYFSHSAHRRFSQ